MSYVYRLPSSSHVLGAIVSGARSSKSTPLKTPPSRMKTASVLLCWKVVLAYNLSALTSYEELKRPVSYHETRESLSCIMIISWIIRSASLPSIVVNFAQRLINERFHDAFLLYLFWSWRKNSTCHVSSNCHQAT